MYDPQRHEMRLMTTYPSGAEMWHCPTCGRMFLTHWPPACARIVLESGDDQAVHVGRANGLDIDLPGTAAIAEDIAPDTPYLTADASAAPYSATSDEFLDMDKLRPWLKYLKQAGLAE
jgi:hypothetical protein